MCAQGEYAFLLYFVNSLVVFFFFVLPTHSHSTYFYICVYIATFIYSLCALLIAFLCIYNVWCASRSQGILMYTQLPTSLQLINK